MLLSTQQNSLRLCSSCFHRNVISSLQPWQSVSLAMVARQYLCPFSLLHCPCSEFRPKRKNVWVVWTCVKSKLPKKLMFRADRRHFQTVTEHKIFSNNSWAFVYIEQESDTVDYCSNDVFFKQQPCLWKIISGAKKSIKRSLYHHKFEICISLHIFGLRSVSWRKQAMWTRAD